MKRFVPFLVLAVLGVVAASIWSASYTVLRGAGSSGSNMTIVRDSGVTTAPFTDSFTSDTLDVSGATKVWVNYDLFQAIVKADSANRTLRVICKTFVRNPLTPTGYARKIDSQLFTNPTFIDSTHAKQAKYILLPQDSLYGTQLFVRYYIIDTVKLFRHQAKDTTVIPALAEVVVR